MTVSYKAALVILLLCPTLLCAQAIKGKISDAVTGNPLGNVSVYLDGTSQGTISDSQGNFTLNNVLKSSTPLVISHIGYQSQKLGNYADGNLNIALKRKVTNLKEVTITSDEIRRGKAMRIFLREFIGANNNDCVIDNPDVINFRYDKSTDILTADADKPLLISNRILGYKITYFLSSFIHAPLKTQYKGNYFFTEDTAGLSSTRIKAIIKARDEAYFGSRMHFIRALWGNGPDKDDFTIYKTLKEGIDYSRTYRLDAANMLPYNRIIQTEGKQKFIMLEKDTETYGNKFDKKEIFITYKRGIPSFLRQENGNNGIIIDSNGYYDEGLEWKGNLSIARVSKLLPFEFMPSR